MTSLYRFDIEASDHNRIPHSWFFIFYLHLSRCRIVHIYHNIVGIHILYNILKSAYKATVVEIVTSTIVDNIQMLASPMAFCFMRYIIPETAVKCFVL